MHDKGRSDPLPDVGRERTRVLGPTGSVHGDGPTASSLLHQLLTQHVLVGPPVRRQELGGNVPTGAFSWMQVRTKMHN